MRRSNNFYRPVLGRAADAEGAGEVAVTITATEVTTKLIDNIKITETVPLRPPIITANRVTAATLATTTTTTGSRGGAAAVMATATIATKKTKGRRTKDTTEYVSTRLRNRYAQRNLAESDDD
jgi:acetamidase/formamidase